MSDTKHQITENRQKLKKLSEHARELQEEEFQDLTINEILLQEFYTDADNTEFNTFWQWKAKGMSVKKGEKAFLVWGKKRKSEKIEKPDVEKDEFEFFPICYLFSNNQVEPSNNAENKGRTARVESV